MPNSSGLVVDTSKETEDNDKNSNIDIQAKNKKIKLTKSCEKAKRNIAENRIKKPQMQSKNKQKENVKGRKKNVRNTEHIGCSSSNDTEQDSEVPLFSNSINVINNQNHHSDYNRLTPHSEICHTEVITIDDSSTMYIEDVID